MDTQKRYTDRELIIMLQILASDLGKRPTHRQILKDSRLPTHHTYINRFGSLKEALLLADLDTLEDRSYTRTLAHEMLRSEFGEDNVGDRLQEEIATYPVKIGDDTIYIDFLDLAWSDDDDHTETIEEIKRIRSVVFEGTGRGEHYRMVSSLKEIALLGS